MFYVSVCTNNLKAKRNEVSLLYQHTVCTVIEYVFSPANCRESAGPYVQILKYCKTESTITHSSPLAMYCTFIVYRRPKYTWRSIKEHPPVQRRQLDTQPVRPTTKMYSVRKIQLWMSLVFKAARTESGHQDGKSLRRRVGTWNEICPFNCVGKNRREQQQHTVAFCLFSWHVVGVTVYRTEWFVVNNKVRRKILVKPEQGVDVIDICSTSLVRHTMLLVWPPFWLFFTTLENLKGQNVLVSNFVYVYTTIVI